MLHWSYSLQLRGTKNLIFYPYNFTLPQSGDAVDRRSLSDIKIIFYGETKVTDYKIKAQTVFPLNSLILQVRLFVAANTFLAAQPSSIDQLLENLIKYASNLKKTLYKYFGKYFVFFS